MALQQIRTFQNDVAQAQEGNLPAKVITPSVVTTPVTQNNQQEETTSQQPAAATAHVSTPRSAQENIRPGEIAPLSFGNTGRDFSTQGDSPLLRDLRYPNGEPAPEETPVPEEIVDVPEQTPTLYEDREYIEKELLAVDQKSEPLLKNIRKLSEQESFIEKKLVPIHEEERGSDDRIETMKQDAEFAQADERQKIELERWQEEQRRRAIEEKRWSVEEELDTLRKNILEIENQQKQFTNRKVELAEEIKKINRSERAFELEKQLEKIDKERERLETRWIGLNTKHQNIASQIDSVLDKEARIEQEREETEVQEHSTSDIYTIREAEKKRWQLEEEIHATEQERWGLEGKLNAVDQQIASLKPRYQSITNQANDIKEQLTNFSDDG